MCTRLFLNDCTVADFVISLYVLNKTVIPLALVGYDIVISQLMLRASLAFIIFYYKTSYGILRILNFDWLTSNGV